MTSIALDPALAPEKSTNVRADDRLAGEADRRPAPVPLPLSTRALGLGIRAVGAFSPALAGRIAGRLFLTPSRHAAPAREAALFASARRLEMTARSGERIAAWSWTAGDPAAPVVLLVHGWAGRAGQLGAFVEPLVRAGYEVVAFDHVAHGGSEGRLASLAGFARTIADVVECFGDRGADGRRGVEAIVAHSLGGAATVLALAAGVRARRAVLVAPPSRPLEFTERVAAGLGLGPRILEALRADVERRAGARWADLDVLARARGVATPVRIVHDRDDAEVAWDEAADLAAALPRSEIVVGSGLGHSRILRDPAVVADAVRFIGR